MLCKKTISLILPCRNEEKALKELFKKIPPCIDEVIVVDNLSTDRTVTVARSLGARVFTEERADNGIGYGFALATGIKNATGEILVCMDGDESYPVTKIPTIVSHLLDSQIDFISCNRLPVLSPKKMSSFRLLGVNLLNLLVWLLFNYSIKDSLTGMWVLKKTAIPDLTIFEGGWNFSLEIKLSAIINPKVHFSEFHIPYHDRVFDASKQNLFKTGTDHFLFLLKKRFLSHKYLLNSQLKISLLD